MLTYTYRRYIFYAHIHVCILYLFIRQIILYSNKLPRLIKVVSTVCEVHENIEKERLSQKYKYKININIKINITKDKINAKKCSKVNI